ncbi:hypothetical protein CPC08DRAFT_678255 [Agrocybe pediades]|nr:hypothetical protein CPC08DRAFT_678255 [Agrocybe pediades]
MSAAPGHFIVATHVSSLCAKPPTVFVVETARQNIPLPNPLDDDLPLEHATACVSLTTPTTGAVIMRVIHGGLIVELASLSTPVPPLRIVFPSILLPTPSIFLLEDSEIHLIAVTELGSLYRIVIPIDGLNLWKDQTENVWPREHFVRNMPVEHPQGCFVHVQGPHCLSISLPHGVLLRLEAEMMGYDAREEMEWSETVFHHGSFFSSLTSYLPLHSGHPNAPDTIAIASHPWPTDIGNVWTLSRDRMLRLWKPKLGCVTSKMLPSTPNAKDPSTSASGNAKYLLLDEERQNLIKIFSTTSKDDGRVDIYALVFIPTPSSTSGGFFCIVDTSTDHFVEVGIIECPRHTAHRHLQDFIFADNTLCTLWDSQGRSVVESTTINISSLRTHDLQPASWTTSQYMQEPELTPAVMEEQLLTHGSLSDKFLEAILKPGVFSPLTLQIALNRYVEACRTLPGVQPPQLSHTYPSLAENIAAVVGCTVTLNREQYTGRYLNANYWTALKRDWEGFVARCRDVERSARWPLSIVSQGPDGIVIIERERVGSLVIEDVPISIRRQLESDQPPHSQYEIIGILWALRHKMGPRMLASVETRTADLLHQEIAFSFAEILQDQARTIQLKENLEPGADLWFAGRLQSVPDLDKATRAALDAIGGFDFSIKRELTDAELLNPPPVSEWLRSQAAAYSTTSTEARYDLCLCLIILLLFSADTLQDWDATLLAEVYAVFRAISILRFVGHQPAEGRNAENRADVTSSDDVVTKMRNMNVSKHQLKCASVSSLTRLLISQSPITDGIATAAHNFMDFSGLCQSISTASVTKQEILFCERIRSLGFNGVAHDLLAWFPRTPSVVFLKSLVFMSQGRVDDAALLLEKLAGSFGINMLTLEDSEALLAVLPPGLPVDSQYSFYLFAADLFRHTFASYEVHFSKLAIQVAPPGTHTAPLWTAVVKGLIDLALYEDAYASVMSIPFEKEKLECATHLAIRMCEENAVEKLMSFDFAGVASEVEAALAFKVRNADPRLRPCYSRILYTWYTRKGDYRNASLTMYQRARKLQDIITDSQAFIALAEDQLESLSVAINALYLVDEKFAWVVMPVVPDPTGTRQKLSKHIPESQYISSKYDAELIQLSDMECECSLLRAQIDIIKRDPSILSSPEYRLPAPLIVMRLAQANQYNQAMATARSLKVDMTDVFIHLTRQCIRLFRNPGSVLQEDTSGWLLTDNAASWQGNPSDRGWRYLQQSLKRYDGPDTDNRYAKAAFETILSLGRSSLTPPWLVEILAKHQPEYLIRISLKYENLTDAVNFAYALILKSDKQLSRETFKDASTTWLPYALIDQVLTAADAQMNPPQNLIPLRTTINDRIRRVQKLSHRPVS